MFDTYKPSGRFSPVFVVWLSVGVVVVSLAAYLYQLGLYWIPLIYVNFLLTLVMGFVVGVTASTVIRFGKIRNTTLALFCFLVLAVSAIAAKFGSQYLSARGRLANITQSDIQQEGIQIPPDKIEEFKQMLLDSYTFKEHIAERVENGWAIGKAGRANNDKPVSGLFVYVVWSIEAIAILYISFSAALSAVRKPFSEKVGVWADEDEIVMTLPVTNEEMVAKIKAAVSVQDLLELPIPKSDESNQFAVYTVHSVPGQEMEDAYLTVELQTHTVNAKGENQVASKSLVNNAILSSAQRTQLKENSEIMNEAFAAYRASKSQPQAAEQSTAQPS